MTELQQEKLLQEEKARMLSLFNNPKIEKRIKKGEIPKVQINSKQHKIQKISPDSQPKIKAHQSKISVSQISKKIIPKSVFLISLVPLPKTHKLSTPIIAIDCEMVVCTDSQKHLARLSIVNFNRHTLFDEFIKPELPVKNYLNHITNIDSFKLQTAHSLAHYLPIIQNIINDKTIVGHTLSSDFEALKIEINERQKRDISEFSFFKNEKFKVGLKDLTDRYLNMKIQDGKHSSVEDARAALELYKLYKQEIDRETKDRFFQKSTKLIV